MRTSATIAVFAGVLATVFAVAFGVGGVMTPMGEKSRHDSARSGSASGTHRSHAGADGPKTAGAALPGLASSEAGYTFVPTTTILPRAAHVKFEFVIEGPSGKVLTAYTRSHEKDLHLIVVRRDVQYFQHVHPERSADGKWMVDLDLPAAGVYRAFADFRPSALSRELTLGVDLLVPGIFEPVSLPEPVASARVDGYAVALRGAATAGRETELTFTVTRDGREVTNLEPYLGAFGHLVSLRAGDLAYLHTHPAEEASDGDRGGPAVRFVTGFPTASTYRLFLDFKVGGVVRTAAFSVSVPRPAGREKASSEPPTPQPSSTETTSTHGH